MVSAMAPALLLLIWHTSVSCALTPPASSGLHPSLQMSSESRFSKMHKSKKLESRRLRTSSGSGSGSGSGTASNDNDPTFGPFIPSPHSDGFPATDKKASCTIEAVKPGKEFIFAVQQAPTALNNAWSKFFITKVAKPEPEIRYAQKDVIAWVKYPFVTFTSEAELWDKDEKVVLGAKQRPVVSYERKNAFWDCHAKMIGWTMRDNLVQFFTIGWDFRYPGNEKIQATMYAVHVPFNSFSIVKFFGFEGYVTVQQFGDWQKEGEDGQKSIGKTLFLKGETPANYDLSSFGGKLFAKKECEAGYNTPKCFFRDPRLVFMLIADFLHENPPAHRNQGY